SDYSEDAISARLSDPAWVAPRAMRHEKILEHFAARASIIPLRFGTIYLKRGGVERMLAERQAELRDIIERLRGKEEWGVNIFCDRVKLLEAITTLSPVLREMSERAAAASAGQAYLLRKKIEALRADETRAEIRRVIAEIERELSAQSDGATRLRVRQAEGAEHGDLSAKLAFLIERERFDDFRAGAEKLAEEREAAGFRLELTGPWPAYNFVKEG
ncbi:MAG: GvpL/GvpF family gas vesicle protein, partial [Pyrinomonadaceae bacterium]|nr:GvpL/GvpF family gas vesicle protein [Pyrinomonadaceae bacterium]